MPVAEASIACGEGILNFVEAITSKWWFIYSTLLRLRNRGCLGNEYSILEAELLVGALQIYPQVEMVIDMLLFRL